MYMYMYMYMYIYIYVYVIKTFIRNFIVKRSNNELITVYNKNKRLIVSAKKDISLLKFSVNNSEKFYLV